MKRFLLEFARLFCRFVSAVLWQASWFLPFWGLCWYGKLALPKIIRAQFGVEQAQDRLVSLDQLAEIMKQNTSLTNPTALLHYVSAQLSKMSVSVKLNTLEVTSNIMETLALWAINMLWILALIYAIFRIFKSFRARSQAYALAHQVAKQIRPDIFSLQCELAALREEVQALRNGQALPVAEDIQEKPALPNE